MSSSEVYELMKALQDYVGTLEKKLQALESEKEKWEAKEKKLVDNLKKMQDSYECLAEESKGLHEQIDIFMRGFKEFQDRVGFLDSGK
jgi:predicted  nucleic acid-binding Zn-ribbon protein